MLLQLTKIVFVESSMSCMNANTFCFISERLHAITCTALRYLGLSQTIPPVHQFEEMLLHDFLSS